MYELELIGIDASPPVGRVDPLRYQAARAPTAAAQSGELMTIKVRYESPAGGESKLLRTAVQGAPAAFESASTDLRFAAAVAGFGMLLRDSPHAGHLRYDDVRRIARAALGADRDGYRREFLELVGAAQQLDTRVSAIRAE